MAHRRHRLPGQHTEPMRSWRIGVATVFTVLMLGVAWPHFTGAGFLSLLKNPNWFAAFLALIVYALVNGVRALRFRLVGGELSFRLLYGIATVHAALLRVMPLRSGELAYGVLIKRAGGGTFAEGMAGLVMVRILDLSFVLPLVALVGVGLFSTTGQIPVMAAMGGLGLFFGLAFFALGPILKKRRSRYDKSGYGTTPSGLSLRSKLSNFLDTLAKISSLPVGKKWFLVGLTFVHWALLITWILLCLLALGVTSDVTDGFIAAVLGIAGSVAPISLFGSFGPMESGLALGISEMGRSSEFIASGALLVSALTFACSWILALPAWILIARSRGEEPVKKNMEGATEKNGFAWEPFLAAGFVVFGAVLLVFKKRYGFELNDQFQYLLLPYRSIYEDFLIGDWFTWQTTHYHVTFSYIIRALHALAGESGFTSAVFALHLLVLAGIPYGIYRLARAAGWNLLCAAIGLVIIAFLRSQGIGGALVTHGILLPADMAMPPLLIGLACWMEGRKFETGLWLGLSGFLHANFAILGPLVVAPLAIVAFSKNRSFMPILKLFAGYLLLAWPALIVIFKSFLFSEAGSAASDILFTIRSPHHYHPELLDSTDPWWPIALVVIGLPALLSSRLNGGKLFGATVVVLIISQFIAGLGVALDAGWIIRLFFWRLSVPLMVLGAVAVGQTIVHAFKSRRAEEILFAVAGVIVLGGFSTKGWIRLDGEFELAGYAMLLPGLVFLCGAGLIIRFFPRRWFRVAGGGLCAGVILWAVFVTVPNSVLVQRHAIRWQIAWEEWTRFDSVVTQPAANRSRNRNIYRWIRDETPKNAVFLTPPGLDDFRLRSRRGMFVDWKCCPMKGEEILEWRRRMLAAMGTSRFRSKGYALYRRANRLYLARPIEELAHLAREEGLTHILHLARRADPDAGLTKLVTRGRWTVYAVKPVVN